MIKIIYSESDLIEFIQSNEMMGKVINTNILTDCLKNDVSFGITSNIKYYPYNQYKVYMHIELFEDEYYLTSKDFIEIHRNNPNNSYPVQSPNFIEYKIKTQEWWHKKFIKKENYPVKMTQDENFLNLVFYKDNEMFYPSWIIINKKTRGIVDINFFYDYEYVDHLVNLVKDYPQLNALFNMKIENENEFSLKDPLFSDLISIVQMIYI